MISSEKRFLNKVPEVTAIFWAIKVLSTTVGETFADFINTNLGLGLIKTSVLDRKSTRLNSSHVSESRMPSSA